MLFSCINPSSGYNNIGVNNLEQKIGQKLHGGLFGAQKHPQLTPYF